ncbi:MAG TPA: glycosyltransferase family 2 protein [Gaiellaceae bacterium]|jgi:GT2 family glycosyltransferase
MRFSVVTPCLNPGPRLARCLESVAAQTHPGVEHVVIDGGSTDGTVEMLEASGVRFVSEPDGGQTEAIAKGFAIASGQILTWLNADDELLPNAAACAAAANADWVYGDCIVVEGARRRMWRPPPRFGNWEVDAGEMIPQPGCWFSRQALDSAGGLDTSFELAMDVDLWIRLLDSGVAAHYVGEPLAVFVIHPTSKTGALGKDQFQLEHARALAKSGRVRAASAAVGRATALGDPAAMREQPQWADSRIVRAASMAEQGIEAVRRGRPVGALRLFAPQVLIVRESRLRLLAAARRALRLG